MPRSRPTRPATPRRQFSRSDRVSEVVREVAANELERLGDERLELVTVTGVEVSGDLSVGRVYYSALIAAAEGREEEVAAALEELRPAVQQAVNRAVRARRTPRVEFCPDDVLRSALRIDDLIEGRGSAGDEPS